MSQDTTDPAADSFDQRLDSNASLGGLPALALRRPLLVMVMNLLIALAGLAALSAVEVRELPDVDRPVVTVRGNLPGAAPETVDAEVTSKVEAAVARVSGIQELSSSSEENNFRSRATFNPGTDLETAAADIREAVARVERQLPDGVEQVTVIKADADADPIIRLVAWSDTLTADALVYKLETDVIPALIAVPGVADVSLTGDRAEQLQVIVDPLRLAAYGLAISDVAAVLQSAPLDVPAGSFRSTDQELIVRADATAATASQIAALEIRDGIKVRDIARVQFAPEEASSFERLDGRPVVGLGIIRRARSNTVAISDAVRQEVEALSARFSDITLKMTSDDAEFIRGSISEVSGTLMIAVGIVIATIWAFTGSLRLTLIPTVAIPVSIIGTLAAIWALGFSINLITLLALVLATGMIVDDSIVVLENIQRRQAQGMSVRVAALLGTRQVFFAVIATTLTLISVFIPISFLPSTAGRMFQEFGIVLAVAIAISSFVALSLVPMLTARLGGDKPSQPPALLRVLGLLGQRLYNGVVLVALRLPAVTLAVALLAGGIGWILVDHLDQELLPAEDRGVIYVFATGPDGVGLDYSERQADRIEAILQPYVDSGEIESLQTTVGRWDLNRVFVAAPLAPWEERHRSQSEIIAELRGPLGQIPGAIVRAFGPNSLGLRGSSGGGLSLALTGGDYDRIFTAAQAFTRAMDDRVPGVSNSRVDYQPTQPQLSVRIDRQRAEDLAVPLEEVATTLRAMINGLDVADLNVDDRTVPLVIRSNSSAITRPGDLVNLTARAESGALIPLSSVATLTEEGVAAELDRQAQRRAISLDADLDEGTPLQEAVTAIQALAEETLPPGIDLLLTGEAATLDETSSQVMTTYGLAMLVVFLVLAAQFESLTSALVVMVTVPFGLAAAVFALVATGTSINIYSQIGLVMLIGLMAKNGILVVEFADQLRDAGHSVREAIETAAKVRLRPIAMTVVSTVLGGLPLILSDGPGAEARAAIGWVVFGGLGIAALFTLFLTPVAYLCLASLVRPRAAAGQRLEAELATLAQDRKAIA